MRRMGMTAEAAADALLAGSAAAVREKLARVRDAGVDMLFVPTMFLPKDARSLLERFMREVAPAFR
jgi:alkanesulfonate monooxygenase SsuD/methylene tetrahydromethanopterin reductase-like flavin-dependent oxidoreductase (luciferase family)